MGTVYDFLREYHAKYRRAATRVEQAVRTADFRLELLMKTVRGHDVEPEAHIIHCGLDYMKALLYLIAPDKDRERLLTGDTDGWKNTYSEKAPQLLWLPEPKGRKITYEALSAIEPRLGFKLCTDGKKHIARVGYHNTVLGNRLEDRKYVIAVDRTGKNLKRLEMPQKSREDVPLVTLGFLYHLFTHAKKENIGCRVYTNEGEVTVPTVEVLTNAIIRVEFSDDPDIPLARSHCDTHHFGRLLEKKCGGPDAQVSNALDQGSTGALGGAGLISLKLGIRNPFDYLRWS